MTWHVERESKYLAANEEIVYTERLNWVYGALPLFRVVVIALAIVLARLGTFDLWIIPIAILAIQLIRMAGFAGRLSFVAVAAILALIWAGAEFTLDESTRNALFWSLLIAAIIKGVLDFYFTRLFLTDKRILLRTGILTERRSTLPLRALTDMRYDQTLLGRVFDYGHFYVESAGQDQALSQLRYVDNPIDFYKTVMERSLGGQSPSGTSRDVRPWD